MKHSRASFMSPQACSRTTGSRSCGLYPSALTSVTLASTCWRRPARRTMTNSPRIEPTMPTNLTRSSSGFAGSRTSSSTRWKKASILSSRLMNSAGSRSASSGPSSAPGPVTNSSKGASVARFDASRTRLSPAREGCLAPATRLPPRRSLQVRRADFGDAQYTPRSWARGHPGASGMRGRRRRGGRPARVASRPPALGVAHGPAQKPRFSTRSTPGTTFLRWRSTPLVSVSCDMGQPAQAP